MEICKVVDIKKEYYNDKKITPLDSVSLALNNKDFISIKGESGVGKSTLLYIMGGMLTADSGKVFIDDVNINDLDDYEKTKVRREKIGFIYQETYLIQALTIEENLRFIQDIVVGKEDKSEIDEIERLLNKLGLWEKRSSLSNELSGGQRRRAMIACALLKNPLLILADEPTNDLDKYWKERVLELLYEYSKKGSAVVMVTHLDEPIEYINKQYYLLNGKIELIE